MEITYASPSSLDLAASSSSAASSSASAMPHTNRPVKVIPLQHPTTSSSPPDQSFLSDAFNKRIEILKRMKWTEWIEMVLPCFRWIRTYNYREYLQVDLMAGITVGVMLVPQAMSYAKLAGLQPIYGLYSGFVPIFVYTIFGSSRQLAIGPVALVSLLVSNVLSGIADSSSALYTELAILLALMVGVLECIMGLLRFALAEYMNLHFCCSWESFLKISTRLMYMSLWLYSGTCHEMRPTFLACLVIYIEEQHSCSAREASSKIVITML